MWHRSSRVRSERSASSAATELNRREFARWLWRQLVSMRTALVLLLLLAIAAVPGSLLPQRGVDARAVAAFQKRNPTSAPVLDALGFFDVYTSPWFSAIYLLLMISLIGCIVPRSMVYARALRARPPRVPTRLSRLASHDTFETTASVDDVMAAARRAIGRARIDVVAHDGMGELSAERGYLREAGNLVFHTSLIVVLVGFAAGTLLGSRGAAIVTEGDTFSNTLTQYDEFSSGTLFSTGDLVPFSVTLEDFQSKFQLDGPQRGAPRVFRATGTSVDGSGGQPEPFDITVNNPLTIDGTSVYLVGNGYAPVIRVKDADGKVLFDEAVPFLPVDPTYTSNGVIKVSAARPDQLGFQGFFLPTAISGGATTTPVSAFPAAANPLIGLRVWRGDLGLDNGTPQSVYTLDRTSMKPYMSDGKPLRISLTPGTEAPLPDGSTIEFVALKQYARFQIGSAPLVQMPLLGISAGLVGLVLSLYVKPRRTWVRARRGPDGTTVEIAILDRVNRGPVPADLSPLTSRLREQLDQKSAPHKET